MYWVDCDQRDLVSMFRELAGSKPLKKPKTKKEIKQERSDGDQTKANRRNTLDRSWQSMDTHLHAGNTKAAMELFRQMKNLDSKVKWKESFLLRVIQQLQQDENWERVEFYSGEYLKLFDERAAEVRLNLARMYTIHRASPRKAIKTVKGLDTPSLTEKQTQLARKTISKSKQMIADGVIELGD